jgi:hypothetical protein
MATFWRGILALVAVIGAACQVRVEDPEAPDTSSLEAVYDHPPGLFTTVDFQQLKGAFEQRLELLRTTGSFGSTDALLDSVSVNRSVIANGDHVDETASSRLLAVANVTHFCRGPQGDGSTDDRFGTIHMTFKGGLRGNFPVVWGDFDACSDHVLDAPFSIDGPYSMTVRRRDGAKDVLFLFQGTIRSNLLNFNGALDARLHSDGLPELRIHATDGDLVLSFDAGGQLLARDRTGLWTCDLLKRECVNGTTGERKSV